MAFTIRQIEKIEQTYKNFKRFEEIIRVIFKYNLQGIIKGFELPTALNFVGEKYFQADAKEFKDKPLAQRVRLALQELGPIFVKLGQILSLRVELLPQTIIDELTFLQDHVEPFSSEQARAIIERELGQPLEAMFDGFEDSPIGSASLGQVYRARLKSGKTVAIKVQRPDITDDIEADFEILYHLAEFAEKNVEGFKYRRPTKFLDEVYASLHKELDYEHEESNIQRFREEFRDDPTVYIMDCYPDFSSKKVLTMEYIQGIKARHIRQLDRGGFDRKVIAQRGVDNILRQIFESGFFHADPHPGNIFVLDNNVISFIDFGMVGRLSRQNRETMADFLYSIAKRKPYKAVRVLIDITEHSGEIDSEALERELAELIDRYVNKPLKDVSLARLFSNLSTVLAHHRMIFSSDFSMMLKAIATVEGLGRELDPEINLTDKLKPYFYKLRVARFHPITLAEDTEDLLMRVAGLFREIPDQTQAVLEQLKRGETKVQVEHRGTDSFYVFWNQFINRLIFALILSALLISSSIMVLSGVPPTWHDIPIIGLIGFIIAGLMSLRLLFAIWKKGMF